MAIGGGKRHAEVRRKVGERRGATGAALDIIKPRSGKKSSQVGKIGTRAPGPGRQKASAADTAKAKKIMARSAQIKGRPAKKKAAMAARAQSKAGAQRAAARSASGATRSKASKASSASSRTAKVGKVAAKVAARTGKTKQQSRAAARRIIKKRS